MIHIHINHSIKLLLILFLFNHQHSYSQVFDNKYIIDSIYNDIRRKADSIFLIRFEGRENTEQVVFISFHKDSVCYRDFYFNKTRNIIEPIIKSCFTKSKTEVLDLFHNYMLEFHENRTIVVDGYKMYFKDKKGEYVYFIKGFDFSFNQEMFRYANQDLYNVLLPPYDMKYFKGFPSYVKDDYELKKYIWKAKNGKYIEWNTKTGFVDLYDKKNKYLGTFDPNSGGTILK